MNISIHVTKENRNVCSITSKTNIFQGFNVKLNKVLFYTKP